jgi:hypothetical protein
MTESQIMQILVLIESVCIGALAEPAINRMSPCAPWITRAAFHLLTIGAVARIAAIVWYGDIPTWPSVITGGGITLMLVRDRFSRLESGDRRRAPRHPIAKSATEQPTPRA